MKSLTTLWRTPGGPLVIFLMVVVVVGAIGLLGYPAYRHAALAKVALAPGMVLNTGDDLVVEVLEPSADKRTLTDARYQCTLRGGSTATVLAVVRDHTLISYKPAGIGYPDGCYENAYAIVDTDEVKSWLIAYRNKRAQASKEQAVRDALYMRYLNERNDRH